MIAQLTKEGYEVLHQSMKPYCSFYNAPFYNVLKVHQGAAAEDFTKSNDLVLSNPSYNVRQDANRDNSDHFLLNSEMFMQVSDVVGAALVV